MAVLGADLDISAVDDGLVLCGEIDAHTAPHLESALGTDSRPVRPRYVSTWMP